MAKALYGHVGGPDHQLIAESARLRRRVQDLEDEVARLGAANAALTSLVAEAHRDSALADLDELATLETVEIPREVPREVTVTSAALTRV